MADMTDLTRLLQDADPVREDGQLGSDRRSESGERCSRPFPSRARAHALASAVRVGGGGVALPRLGTMAGHRALTRRVPAPPAADLAAVDGQGGGERRQLQFSTPGGTRVIWIFDDNLRLQESMP